MLTMDQYEFVRTAHRNYGKNISELARIVTTDIKRTRFALSGEPTRKLLSSRFLGRMSPITTSEERCPFSVWPEIGGIIFRR